jgi:hypothetical protein
LKSITWLLGKATRSLAKILSELGIVDVQTLTYGVHVQGFREARYDIGDIRGEVEKVRWLVGYVKHVAEKFKKS